MTPSRIAPYSLLSRYIVRQFLGLFLPILMGFVLLYLVVDLFERMDIFIRHDASVGATARYMIFKVPLMVSQITPPAVIAAVLLALGLLARNNEVIAMRAGGVSLPQTAVPLLGAALLISLGLLAWGETVVPFCTRQFEQVNNVEIRKRAVRGILSGREIWYRGRTGFYNLDHVDVEGQKVHGLRIYGLDARFHLDTVTEIPLAAWQAGAWTIPDALRHHVGGQEYRTTRVDGTDIEIPERFEDFLEVRRQPEEMSFRALRDWIQSLEAKGIDASHLLVELHLKLALPFASLVLAAIGIPIAGRVRRHGSMAAIIGLGMLLGFAYWVVLGLASSLGNTGSLPPVVAAWSANVIFLLVALAMFLYGE